MNPKEVDINVYLFSDIYIYIYNTKSNIIHSIKYIIYTSFKVKTMKISTKQREYWVKSVLGIS